jgi:hypothetical protein
VDEVTGGVTYVFPGGVQYRHGVRIVSSHTPEGSHLLTELEAGGMPEDLLKMGFADPSHLWPPWCAALDKGSIVSIAFRRIREHWPRGMLLPAWLRGQVTRLPRLT